MTRRHADRMTDQTSLAISALAALLVLAPTSVLAQPAPPPTPAQPAYGQPGQPAPGPANGQPAYGQPAYGQPSTYGQPVYPQGQGYGYGPPPPPPPPPAAPEHPRSPGEIFVGLGFGNAVCDNEKPNSDCPVDGAFTLGFGGGWRFHDNFAVGGELGIWAFKVRDEWQGQLDDKATDVTFNSFYLAPYLRWYWFDEGGIDPYLQAGVGIGSVTAEASNDAGTYKYTATGFVFPVGIGVDWYISDGFRLGPQALAYLHVSDEICTEEPNRDKTCEPPTRKEDGEREGLALPWRIMAVGTFTLGDP